MEVGGDTKKLLVDGEIEKGPKGIVFVVEEGSVDVVMDGLAPVDKEEVFEPD